ncbi:MAG: hypothetical protein L0387_01675 [Acidobacteria bacterium]|nr:hypothetical protein [Acidobacteriota bacterium]MCI0620380.1 hypothetical protein [Acidobacteriota bacterium]MCI0719277.1 hypothetical protein [Acidobacteriota bacterium]
MQIANVGTAHILDDWCGTKPKPLPWPPPKGPQILDKASLVGFNPQPEPPKASFEAISKAAFNPQQLSAFDDDWCGTVPRKPPLPDPPPPLDLLSLPLQLR